MLFERDMQKCQLMQFGNTGILKESHGNNTEHSIFQWKQKEKLHQDDTLNSEDMKQEQIIYKKKLAKP